MTKRTLFLLLVLLCLVPVLARSQGQITACKSNMKNIGTACEMYLMDFSQYPESLDLLTPNYLKTIPECPTAGKVTYYYCHEENPETYAVFCKGETHDRQNFELNSPAYDSNTGLVEGRNRPAEDVLECSEALRQVGEKIEKIVEQGGSYPTDLSAVEIPDITHWEPFESSPSPLYWTNNQDQFVLCCPGAFHVTSGHRPFYPRYVSDTGLHLKRLPERMTPEGVGKVNWPLLGYSLGIGVIILLGFVWLATRDD